MSRLSQMVNFINANPIPSQSSRNEKYMGISDFDELVLARSELRKEQRANEKQQSSQH